jgi:Arc/MetJ family transcription regulator
MGRPSPGFPRQLSDLLSNRLFPAKARPDIDKCIPLVHTDTYDLDERCMTMRTTLNIEDGLVERASELTGIKEKTTLVKLGLESLIAKESARRLAKLGGTERQLKATPRRRTVER